MDSGVADAFHESWYLEHKAPWSTTWNGHSLIKNPLDLWVCAEIIHETQPDVIIETGTFAGGSAIFYADMQSVRGIRPNVISVDVAPLLTPPHRGVRYVIGDSVSVDLPRFAGTVMVILDSDHSSAHVQREMDRFGPMVTSGCYMVVEDSNVGGNPVKDADFPTGGPHAAIMEWLPSHPEFSIDKRRERYVLTMNPDGWLRKGV